MATDSARSPCNRGFLVKHKLLSIRQGLRKSWRYTFYIGATFLHRWITSAAPLKTYKILLPPQQRKGEKEVKEGMKAINAMQK